MVIKSDLFAYRQTNELCDYAWLLGIVDPVNLLVGKRENLLTDLSTNDQKTRAQWNIENRASLLKRTFYAHKLTQETMARSKMTAIGVRILFGRCSREWF